MMWTGISAGRMPSLWNNSSPDLEAVFILSDFAVLLNKKPSCAKQPCEEVNFLCCPGVMSGL